MCDPKKCGPKKMLLQKYAGPEKNVVLKKMLKSGPKNNSGGEKNLVKNHKTTDRKRA